MCKEIADEILPGKHSIICQIRSCAMWIIQNLLFKDRTTGFLLYVLHTLPSVLQSHLVEMGMSLFMNEQVSSYSAAFTLAVTLLDILLIVILFVHD